MLRFEDVTFRYEGEDAPMLEGLSFHVARGEFVSLIGASGFLTERITFRAGYFFRISSQARVAKVSIKSKQLLTQNVVKVFFTSL